ncbi:hypothetical protein EV361DRAFT_943988 [Lentinula raphanica]|uniref:GDP-fucose protein O-fucosyltransferase 2 n=1 Tax=Lentinula raphanica TaxID=153919 RepID=A0AA38PL39_9AGAR|nr:hypothetical protein F5878DRAFT_600649 [Lentinula raphanica]KAJ3977893.1 hypothetical protein EV361DRAFT_943988 [Lentinula raphanica]
MDTKTLPHRLSSDSENSLELSKEAQRLTGRTRRHGILVACSLLVVLSFVGISAFVFWTPYFETLSHSTPISAPHDNVLEGQQPVEGMIEPSTLDPWDPRISLNGLPTAQFRDNLKQDVKYITSWPGAGWTNDVMTYANLIYLGFITDRVPVVPMFTPSHINVGATSPVPTIAFGEVFDLPRLRNLTGKAVLEWRDVKDPESEAVDDIGCWNIWEAVQYREHYPRRSSAPDHLKLDISYTKAPAWVKLIPDFEHDPHATFWSLARLAFPQALHENAVTPLKSPLHGTSLPPDEHMLCYDYMYYVCAQQPYEYDTDYSPAWRYVAQYMHWVPSIQDLANIYLNRAFGIPEGEATPPYIAIHVRHYDFAYQCKVPIEECFATIPVIARRVKEVQDQLLQEQGVVVNHVIMTSDEKEEAWWQEVADQNWSIPDHSKTKELYGHWHPVLIDAIIQSGGVGFVGTWGSTMSILAKRRVEAWQGGVTRLVKWGYVGADDH